MIDRTNKDTAPRVYLNPPDLIAEMRRIVTEVETSGAKPYRDILERNGFNPDGDYLYLPKRYTDAAGLTPYHIPLSLRDRVVITPLSDTIMCVRDWKSKVSR